MPPCPGFTPIGKDGYGYCQIMYQRVYKDVQGELCLCDYCHADAEGKRSIDPDVYFHGNGLVGLHSRDAKKLDAMKVAAEAMPLAPKPVPRPEQCKACYRGRECQLQYPGCNLFNSKAGLAREVQAKAAAMPAKAAAPAAKKKVSLFDFKP